MVYSLLWAMQDLCHQPYRGDPFKGTLLHSAYGSLQRDLIERVYILEGPPNTNSHEPINS